ncbi:MAG: apolipoprotein A-IV repeat region-like domain-containing protein [Xanthobacteraceae bacterium]
MANSPKKSKDPTELALSAIEDALAVRDNAPPTPAAPPVAPTPRRDPLLTAPVEREEPARRARTNPQLDTATERRRFDRAPAEPVFEDTAAARRAANDDRESVGNILRALQRRPSKTPTIVAWLFTACWVIFYAGLVFGTYSSEIGELLSQGTSSVPIVIGLIGGFFAPIVLFFFLAAMLTRAQELRLVGQSMAEIALRLAEPETVARDSIVSVGQAVRREVAAIGDGVERALARAGELEGLVNNEVAALERAYADNEARMRGLIDGIVTQRETLIGHAEQVRAAIGTVHIDLSHEIGAVSEMVAEQVHDASRKITESLEEKGEHITRALQQSGDSMIAALGDRGDDLLERLEQASETTTRAIETASERMAVALSFKTTNINEEFAEITESVHHMLTGKLDRVADDFSSKTLGIIDNMDERARSITEALVETSSGLAESIAARVDEVNNTLKATGDSLVLDLSLRGGDVVSKLEQTGTSITEAITGSGGRVSDTFQQHAEALTTAVSTQAEALTATVSNHSSLIRDLLAQRLAAFEEMFSHGGTELGERIAQRLGEFEAMFNQTGTAMADRIANDTTVLGERISRDASTLGDLITRQLSEFDNTVRTYGGELVERIGQRSHEIDETMREYVDGFDGRVTAKVSDVTTALDQRLSRFQDALDDRTKSINDGLSSRVMEIAKSVAGGGREIVAALDQRVETLNEAMNARAAQIAEVLASKTEDIDRTLGVQANQVAANFDQRIDRFEALLLGRAESVVSEIEARGLATANRLSATLQDITSNVNQAEQAIGSLSTNSGGSLRLAAAEAERTIQGVTSQAEQALSAMSMGISNSIRQTASDVERTIGTSSSQVETSITSLTSNLSSTLKIAAAEVERTMTNVSSQVANDFIGKADAIAGAIGKRSGELTRLLDDKSSNLVQAISLKTTELSNEMSRVGDLTATSIESKGASFARGLREASQEITRGINEASERAAAEVTKTMRDLEESSASTIERAKQTASTAVAEMLETNGMLRSDTTVLFERLREANGLLQEVLSGAHTNLGSIEHVLSTRVADFVSTMNNLLEKTGATTTRMDQHIGGFYEVTGKVLENLGDLASKFNQHGRELSDAATMLSTSNQETEQAVADRRGMLEGLVNTLDARTSDLDTRLKRFNGLLDESLAAAESRARDIARTIAEASNANTHTITDQFQAVRDSAETEQRRTLDAMRQIYEHATGDAQSMFQGAAERFSEIMQGMKHMAGDMQRELETTRQELRRGILELPQETAESAAQMRRVIVDQIEALAELNRIVARHGREIETTEPARRAPREEAVVGAGQGRESSRAAYVGNSPPVAPPAARRSEPRNEARSEAPLPSAPPANQGQGPTAGQTNWLSDLLTRASREGDVQPQRAEPRGQRNEERPTRHSIESLDSLSLDIARMIDHDAAAELWDRYNRGERNVFTRKLYTMQGQKAFEEVRRRYRADREFKQTVDRYIAEFERLLEEVSRDDRGQVVARTYLTSETGKVYTMLAHAAGRIE